jgi:hypothetical protein
MRVRDEFPVLGAMGKDYNKLYCPLQQVDAASRTLM